MSLVAIDGTPLVSIGFPPNAHFTPPSTSNVTIDAVNEAHIAIGRVITADGASHTIDTTGSSSLQWREGTTTFANAATTVVVGLATVDAANGPPGRATNVANVITPSVSKSLVGGGGGISSAWMTHVPDTGTMTIANGDLVAFFVQMTARGGADIVRPSFAALASTPIMPFNTDYTGAAYATSSSVPNVMIVFSDGTRGWIAGGHLFTSLSSQTWNNTSGTKEYGNYFSLPFPAKIYGICTTANFGGDADVILYSDPLGTPAAEKTVSVDLNTVSAAAARHSTHLFASPYTTTTSQPLAAIIKPTSATDVVMNFLSMNAAADMVAYQCGTNGYAVNRNAGAFAAQNSSKDRFYCGLLVGAFDDGAGGSSTGISRARAASGF